MQAQLDEMSETLRAYDERWALYEYNLQRLGIESSDLLLPLDPVHRQVVRSRPGRKGRRG